MPVWQPRRSVQSLAWLVATAVSYSCHPRWTDTATVFLALRLHASHPTRCERPTGSVPGELSSAETGVDGEEAWCDGVDGTLAPPNATKTRMANTLHVGHVVAVSRTN